MINRKLKVVILDFDDIKNPLLGGGQARATYEVGKRLVKLGHKLTVLSSKYPGFKDRVEDGIIYKHIGLGSKNIRINNAFYILAVPFALLKLQADIVIECFTAPISTIFSPLFTKIPVVALTSSFEAERFSKLYHMPFDKIEKLGLRFYKYALPLSSVFDEKIKLVNPKLVSKIVPEGVSEEYFKIKKASPKHILFLGRFDVGQKGIDLLLESFSKVSDQIPYKLAIAGMGPDEEKIKKLVKKYNLNKKIKMLGPTYGNKKFKALAESAFVVLPSRHETFSCFALEALASGNGLVIFDVPGLSWVDSKAALRARVFDTDDYAKKILEMSNSKVASEIGKKGKIFAKNFSWEKVAQDFSNFFYKVLETERKSINTVDNFHMSFNKEYSLKD